MKIKQFQLDSMGQLFFLMEDDSMCIGEMIHNIKGVKIQITQQVDLSELNKPPKQEKEKIVKRGK